MGTELNMNKLSKTFSLLTGIVLILLTTSIFAKSTDAEEKCTLNSISFEKMHDWDRLNMRNILGNNLDPRTRQITTQTTALKIMKRGNWYYPGTMYIEDNTDGSWTVNEMYFNSDGVANVHVREGTFRKNHCYSLYCTYQYNSGSIDDELVARFRASANNDEKPIPPTITAYSRSIIKDDSEFNIMNGVSAKDYQGNDITRNITYTGSVDVHRVGEYPIIYSVVDKNGLSATKKIIISVKSSTVPLSKPIVNEVTDKDTTITGEGVPNTSIYVILGTGFETYRGNIDQSGKFMIRLEHPYPAGTSIDAYVEDKNGNKSEDYYGIVKAGDLSIGVNQILSSDTYVSGYTSPGAEIEVAVNNMRQHIFTGMADSTGKYNIGMHGLSYPAGTAVDVTAKLNGRSSSKSVIVYPKRVSIDTVKIGDSILKGEADPNAMVYISVHSKKYQFKSNAIGSFSGNIDQPLLSGDKIIVYQVSNNIESEPVVVDVSSR